MVDVVVIRDETQTVYDLEVDNSDAIIHVGDVYWVYYLAPSNLPIAAEPLPTVQTRLSFEGVWMR